MEYYYLKYKSPIGNLYLIANSDKLVSVIFDKSWKNYSEKINVNLSSRSSRVLNDTKKQLNEYFKKKRKCFDLPVQFSGTEFQINTWYSLLKIPYGQTISYSQQAQLIHKPLAVRGVGTANSKNKLPIIIPCHRVIGKNGKLSGYGGGVSIKRKLLNLEQGL